MAEDAVVEARMRETLARILNDLDSSPWLVGKKVVDEDRVFAVRKEDVYAYTLRRIAYEDFELVAITRDGNAIPISQGIRLLEMTPPKPKDVPL